MCKQSQVVELEILINSGSTFLPLPTARKCYGAVQLIYHFAHPVTKFLVIYVSTPASLLNTPF
jgi:hypothetical protein